MMKGRNRNHPCWCGSGKKFKKCHEGRESQQRDNPWQAIGLNRRAFTTKKCFARDAGLGDCDGRVIKAHTVSRGPNLAKIAKDGHVLQYVARFEEMKKNGGKLSFGRIGIGDASVFYGFCSKHDRELFSCIENETFSGRPEQCLAVAYRTLSRELYGKDAGEHLRETLRGADKGRRLFEQVRIQQILEDIDTGNNAARRELKATHDAMTQALAVDRFNVITSAVLEFDGLFPFMFAGAWSPFTDLRGVGIQEGYLDELLEQVMVASFAGEKRTMICISWRNIENAPGQVIANQLLKLPDSQVASVCLQFVVKHIENVFYNPDWFHGLAAEKRDRLDQLAADGIGPIGNVPSIPVDFDLDLQLPKLVRFFFV